MRSAVQLGRSSERDSLTGRQVLDDHHSSSMENNISTIVEVMQVISTVKASVAEDVFQQQLLQQTQHSNVTCRSHSSVKLTGSRILTSTTFFFLVTLFFSSLSGSGAARLTGGLKTKVKGYHILNPTA